MSKPPDLGRSVYSIVCSRDGVTARDISRELGIERTEVNQLLYTYPFIRDLCYRDETYRWHGLIRQGFPHEGLGDYCGWYGFVSDFCEQGEGEWLAELEDGCRRIGRNLNDTRGLVHSFTDAREVMLGLFKDLQDYGLDCSSWEVAFELRIKRAKWIRIYADVLVVTPECVSEGAQPTMVHANSEGKRSPSRGKSTMSKEKSGASKSRAAVQKGKART